MTPEAFCALLDQRLDAAKQGLREADQAYRDQPGDVLTTVTLARAISHHNVIYDLWSAYLKVQAHQGVLA